MKQYSASAARAHWFSILDEVVEGQTVVIERKGRRVLLRCEESVPTSIPDYSKCIQSPDVDNADLDPERGAMISINTDSGSPVFAR